MGQDIHIYIEHRAKVTPEQAAGPFGMDQGWKSFGGSVTVGREFLDEVFRWAKSGRADDMGFAADYDSKLRVVSGTDLSGNPVVPREGECTADKAQEWTSRGLTSWTDDRRTSVWHPDWHGFGTIDAVGLLGLFRSRRGRIGLQWRAVRNALTFFEKEGREARVVFWFDN